MIPVVIILVGLALLSLRTRAVATTPQLAQPTVSGIAGIRVERPAQPNRKFRRILAERIRNSQPVTRWLVDAAMAEAYSHRDVAFINIMTQKFPGKSKPQAEPSVSVDAGDDQAGQADQTDRVDGDTELSELGAQPLKSPLDGVSDEDWMEFVSRVRTQNPGFKSDRYVGQYEQNRERLSRLGIPEPESPDSEHEVLARDIAAHAAQSAGLVNRWSGDVVNINGVDHPVCASGVYGLLKSAGPEGAESWLTNPADRTRYPKTTEAFLRTNGCF